MKQERAFLASAVIYVDFPLVGWAIPALHRDHLVIFCVSCSISESVLWQSRASDDAQYFF
jgi:hypothetical protein